MLNRRVFIQWVPGHIGLIGNEWADSAAGDAAAMTTEADMEGEISYQSAKAFIGREINDPPISHARTKMVFDGKRKATALSRKDAVMIAQLRSGHCHKLAAYRNIVDAESSPYCPHCKVTPETLEHWLQECPATAQKKNPRFRGSGTPSLSPGGKPRGCYRVCAWTLVHANATPHNNNNNHYHYNYHYH